MKSLLITGGAGFIGSHVVQHFLTHYPQYTIINLDKLGYAGNVSNMQGFFDHPRHIFIKGDIIDKFMVEKIFVDYDISGVIHLAAESHVDNSIHAPDVFIQSNIVGTFTLLEAAKKHWRGNKKDNRFYHISTDEVFGALGATGHFTEDSPYLPNSPYSASKASSDHLVRSFVKTYDLNAVITHCSNNYGPHQHAEKFIPTVIRNALLKRPIPIYGNGKNVRDWLYVEDHCRAIDVVFHQAQPGENYNIGGNNELSNIELATHLCQQLDQILPWGEQYASLLNYVKDRPGHDFRYAVSTQKIQQRFQWQPRYTFSQALHNTLAYYIQQATQSMRDKDQKSCDVPA